MTREYGDFQTPPELVRLVVDSLEPVDRWRRALEPTCGIGNFIAEIADRGDPRIEVRGVELQHGHYHHTAERFKGRSNIEVVRADAFAYDYSRVRWSTDGPLLVLGNLPWVTNSDLGCLASSNLPSKSNLKGLQGLEAITGSANFDIAEYLWLKLIGELADADSTIALLCKTAVARNVLDFARRSRLPIRSADIRRFDAKRWFGAAVDACLFTVVVGPPPHTYEAAVYPDLTSANPESMLGFVDDHLVVKVDGADGIEQLVGRSPIEWRQGIKHDAARVMELDRAEDGSFWMNTLGEAVDVEDEYVYPLLKGTALYHGRPITKGVIVPQRHPRDDTTKLEAQAPRLWRYLNSHVDRFQARRSSIYRSAPPFAIFGVGPYTFSPYKVCVSGFHKSIRFRAIGPVANKPVLLDDTCYFLPITAADQAALIVAALNSQLANELLSRLVFLDSKRPVTKKILQKIDFSRIIDRLDVNEYEASANRELGRLSPSSGPIGADGLDESLFGPLFAAR